MIKIRNLRFHLMLPAILLSCESPKLRTNQRPGELGANPSNFLVDSMPTNAGVVDYSDSINFTDSNGWKQGQWIRWSKGKLVENYMYKNDTLNGHYVTEKGEGYYKNGRMDGYQFSYLRDREDIQMVNFYIDGVHIWGGFPSEGQKFVVPVKEFHISVDSTYVVCPNIYGSTWYEGSFCLLPDSLNNGRLLPHRYGIHRVYHNNGNLKAIVDYDEETIQEFDSLGEMSHHTTFDGKEIHRVPTLGRYRKFKHRRRHR